MPKRNTITRKFGIKHDEEVIVAVNDHWSSITRQFFGYFIAWIIFIAAIALSSLVSSYSVFASQVLIIVSLTFLIFINHWFFLYVIQWDLSNWIITTKRIIEFENKPLILNDVRFIIINEIHEVEKIKHGIIRNVLDYGDVVINVAAVPEPLRLEYVPQPSKFAHLIESIRNSKFREELNITSLRKKYSSKYRFLKELKRQKTGKI